METNEMTLALAVFLAIMAASAGYGWFRSARALKRCKELVRKMEEDVNAARSLDETTGTFNYPFFVKTANVQIKLARRHRWPVTLMVIDVDQLEKINLRYSFKAGDAVLKHLADAIRTTVRSSDVLGRFGGSGIFILLPECDVDNVPAVYERVAEKIAQNPLEVGEKAISYHHTAGAVTMYGMHIQLNKMLDLAEEALNLAKEKGEKLVMLDKEGTQIQWK